MSIFRRLFRLKYKNLKEYIEDIKEKGKNTILITAYKRNKSWSLANPSNFGEVDVIIGLTTDKRIVDDRKYVEYEINVSDYDVLDTTWPDRVYNSLEKKAKEISAELQKDGLEPILYCGFEWMGKKLKKNVK